MVQLGFSVIYEKVQGKSINKIVLDLNQSPTRKLQFPVAYTGITGVGKDSDLKILTISPGHTLHHLTKLKLDQKMVCCLYEFDSFTERWSGDPANYYSTQRGSETKKKLIVQIARRSR